MARTATEFITWTYQQPFRPANVKPQAKKGKVVIEDTADTYSKFVWALAQEFTNSPEEATAAVKEMFADIKQCGETGVPASEDRAWRRLKRFLS